jgi:hypothetical protein
MNMQHKHEAWTCSINLKHEHAARTGSIEPWTCSLEEQHGFAAWTCSMGGRLTFKMLYRKSKMQFVNQECNTQNAMALLNYLRAVCRNN